MLGSIFLGPSHCFMSALWGQWLKMFSSSPEYRRGNGSSKSKLMLEGSLVLSFSVTEKMTVSFHTLMKDKCFFFFYHNQSPCHSSAGRDHQFRLDFCEEIWIKDSSEVLPIEVTVVVFFSWRMFNKHWRFPNSSIYGRTKVQDDTSQRQRMAIARQKQSLEYSDMYTFSFCQKSD